MEIFQWHLSMFFTELNPWKRLHRVAQCTQGHSSSHSYKQKKYATWWVPAHNEGITTDVVSVLNVSAWRLNVLWTFLSTGWWAYQDYTNKVVGWTTGHNKTAVSKPFTLLHIAYDDAIIWRCTNTNQHHDKLCICDGLLISAASGWVIITMPRVFSITNMSQFTHLTDDGRTALRLPILHCTQCSVIKTRHNITTVERCT